MHIEPYMEQIRRCHLFDHIATEDLMRLLSCIGCKVITYAPKTYILDEEDTIEDVGVLYSVTKSFTYMFKFLSISSSID